MTDFSQLLGAAYKSERIASRKLARQTGVAEERALRDTLTLKAGAAGLPALLLTRAAARQALLVRSREREQRNEALRVERAGRHEAPAGTWRAWFDGSARPNPGRCGIGALLTGPQGQRIELSADAGYGNSSEAEYRALIALLEAAIAAGATGLTVHGDSRVVIDDMQAHADAACIALRPLRLQARALLAQLEGASLRWIPRHKNGAADALAARAGDGQTDGVR